MGGEVLMEDLKKHVEHLNLKHFDIIADKRSKDTLFYRVLRGTTDTDISLMSLSEIPYFNQTRSDSTNVVDIHVVGKQPINLNLDITDSLIYALNSVNSIFIEKNGEIKLYKLHSWRGSSWVAWGFSDVVTVRNNTKKV
jgi:hypothetical protein